MGKRIFTKDQIEELLKNENVAKCSERLVRCSKDFKRTAVRLYNEQGFTPSEIFKQAGFNLDIIGRDIPKESLRRWNRIYRAKGFDGLVELRRKSGRGGRPKTKGITDADKIRRLEAEVAYLKAENDFLAKLRAKRRE